MRAAIAFVAIDDHGTESRIALGRFKPSWHTGEEALNDLSDPARRKILALLWAYMGRVDLGDDTLNKG